MKTLVVYDFDWSFIDTDSDHHVVVELVKNGEEQMKKLHETMQWTDLMHHMMGIVHEQGHNPDDIRKSLAAMPFSSHMRAAVEHVKSARSTSSQSESSTTATANKSQNEIIIISDANTVFIDELLKANNVKHLIDHIVTNKAEFDSAGRLNIRRRIQAKDPPHGCTLGTCAVNMCKGIELEQYLKRQVSASGKEPAMDLVKAFEEYKQIIYIGDGKNDFCPITKLRDSDVACVRRGRALERVLAQDCKPAPDGSSKLTYSSASSNGNSKPVHVRPEIVYWDTAADILEVFKRKIQ